MFRGLHIEIAALKILGGLLENNEWTGTFELAIVASSCTADSFNRVFVLAELFMHTR